MESNQTRFVNPFSQYRGVADDLVQLQQTKQSLGGEKLQPVELDLEILADAYPREGSFLSKENLQPSKNANITLKNLSTKSQSSGETGFFRSESEREYAKTLIKELVQIYILQGVHGKDAFKGALLETRRRIHTRRGEDMPELPPAVPSPPIEDWSPRNVTPKNANPVTTPRSARPVQPLSRQPSRVTAQTTTPSRVQAIVTILQTTPKAVTVVENPVRKTPGSSARIKALGDSIEASIAANTPSKRRIIADLPVEAPVESVGQTTRKPKAVEPTSPPQTAPKRATRKAVPVVEEVPKKTTKKSQPEPVSEPEGPRRSTRSSVKAGAAATTSKKRKGDLEPVVEEDPTPTARPSRRAKKN